MNFLLDTNILISAEPTSHQDVERVTPLVATLLGTLVKGHHGLWIHPASIREISGDKDINRRDTRLLLGGKYPQLQQPPSLSRRLASIIGVPALGSHHEVDMLLLSAVDADAVDYLVTEDEGIHKRAKRTGLANRVLTVTDTLGIIRALFPTVPTPPPHVVATVAHALHDDPIFASLRADYAGFDAWLSKCKREQRLTWVIENDTRYAGLCIIKDERTPIPEQLGKAFKICTFKISDAFHGLRYGELLLKTVFSYANQNAYDASFVDVFPKHKHLIELFGDFGFRQVSTKPTGELILLKTFRPGPNDLPLGSLDFNVTYGPFAVRMSGAHVFVVPIQPRFHQLLFPESEYQLQLNTELHPFANSIRKAYLCHSMMRKIRPGDLLLFYCSTPAKAVTALGIVDGTLVSNNASAVARYVGKRTVYAYSEIEKMAEKPILAILFRLSRIFPDAWPLDLLVRSGIIRTAPQSIVTVQRSEALSWVANQLRVWP